MKYSQTDMMYYNRRYFQENESGKKQYSSELLDSIKESETNVIISDGYGGFSSSDMERY
jgi:folate-dependent phosphoribosylglycinamide formyltransferase PurN